MLDRHHKASSEQIAHTSTQGCETRAMLNCWVLRDSYSLCGKPAFDSWSLRDRFGSLRSKLAGVRLWGGGSKICRRIPSTGAAHYKATAHILYCFAKITPQKPSSPLEPNHNQYHMSCGNFACRDRFKVTSQVRAEASSMHGGETLHSTT